MQWVEVAAGAAAVVEVVVDSLPMELVGRALGTGLEVPELAAEFGAPAVGVVGVAEAAVEVVAVAAQNFAQVVADYTGRP